MKASLLPLPIDSNQAVLRLDLTELSVAGPYCNYTSVNNSELPELYREYLLKSEQSLSSDQFDLFFTNGSDSALDLILRTFARQQDYIGCFSPNFWLYEALAEANNIAVQKLPLQGQHLNELPALAPFADAKLVFLCRPNNPVGSSMPLEQVSQLAAQLNGIVVIDEAYAEFSTAPSALSLLTAHSNLIITRSFSKAWGMAGMRVGVAIGHTSLIKQIQQRSLPFPVSAPSLQMACEKLRNHQLIAQSRKKILAARDLAIEQLLHYGIATHVYRSDANFITFDCKNPDCVKAAFEKQHAWVKDCRPALPLGLSISIPLTAADNIAQLLQCVAQELNHHARP